MSLGAVAAEDVHVEPQVGVERVTLLHQAAPGDGLRAREAGCQRAESAHHLVEGGVDECLGDVRCSGVVGAVPARIPQLERLDQAASHAGAEPAAITFRRKVRDGFHWLWHVAVLFERRAAGLCVDLFADAAAGPPHGSFQVILLRHGTDKRVERQHGTDQHTHGRHMV
eukprot:scaffold74618_cov67-Phaeocystis_antarctica.AAC.1